MVVIGGHLMIVNGDTSCQDLLETHRYQVHLVYRPSDWWTSTNRLTK